MRACVCVCVACVDGKYDTNKIVIRHNDIAVRVCARMRPCMRCRRRMVEDALLSCSVSRKRRRGKRNSRFFFKCARNVAIHVRCSEIPDIGTHIIRRERSEHTLHTVKSVQAMGFYCVYMLMPIAITRRQVHMYVCSLCVFDHQ